MPKTSTNAYVRRPKASAARMVASPSKTVSPMVVMPEPTHSIAPRRAEMPYSSGPSLRLLAENRSNQSPKLQSSKRPR